MDKDQIAQEILGYLAEHPDAQDTLEGIVEWWLLERNVRNQTALVKDALAGLRSRGLIIERVGKDSRPRYQLNGRKLKQVSSFLKR